MAWIRLQLIQTFYFLKIVIFILQLYWMDKDGYEYLLIGLSEYSEQSNYKWLSQSVVLPVFNVPSEIMVGNNDQNSPFTPYKFISYYIIVAIILWILRTGLRRCYSIGRYYTRIDNTFNGRTKVFLNDSIYSFNGKLIPLQISQQQDAV